MKKVIIIFFSAISIIGILTLFLRINNALGWASFPNHHGQLAEKTVNCMAASLLTPSLPKPPQRRCEQPVDDKILYKALKDGAAEPDFKDGETSPKHSFNPAYPKDKSWDSAIKATLEPPSILTIGPGDAVDIAIPNEIKDAKAALQQITFCNASTGEYINVWKKFGRLSHYAADLASPLHVYSISVNNEYREGDYIGGHWIKGLYELSMGSGASPGKWWHWQSEFALAEAIDGVTCSQASNITPEETTQNARAVLNNYSSVKGNGNGFLAVIKDYETYPNAIRLSFFKGIGSQQVKDSIGVIKNVWKEALTGFTPLSCPQPPAGGCEEPGQSPGGDNPDETFDVSTASVLPTSEELLEQAWDRLAVKKNKESLVWFWMQSYLYGEYMLGRIDAATYKSRSESYGLTFDVAWELFYNDYITSPDVAIFGRGFALSMSDLLQNKFYEPVRRFTVNDFSPDALKDYPVFIIPSGGLMGLENSEVFRASLDGYVKQGGTLVVFGQQHGYEFNILPVPQEQDGTFKTVTGYGWSEDQSCFTNAAYIDTWHQVLSGQSRSTPTLNVDGYFTGYPSNATVILRRTVNAQPALLTYDYGLGKVIVTSMYSDWAYGHGQASSEEITLVRDIISWAKKPAQLPEIKPGQTVSVSMSATNNTTTDAASVKLQIYNPDRTTVLSTQQLAVSIPAGSSVAMPVSFTSTLTSALGIYHIDYELYDSNGNLIQPQAETDSGRFAVSNPPASPYKSADLNFAVNSDSENYAYGSDAVFTVTVWNNGDADRTITVNYYAYHLNVSGSPKTLTVPSHSSTSFKVIASNITWQGWLVVRFYDENNQGIAEQWKGIWMYYPAVNVSAAADKAIYAKGETVNLTLNLQNKQNAGYTAALKVKVSDPSNSSIYSNTLSVSLAANGTSIQTLQFALPMTAQGGFYIASAEAYDSSNRKIGGDSTSFELPLSQISVVPTLPALSTGSNTIPFVLNNIGKIAVSSGTLDVSLKDPDGNIVYSGNQPFSLGVAQSITQSVNISIPSLKFGNYTLTYIQSDETKTGKPTTVSIPNTAAINISSDKSIYKIGETTNMSITINNSGKFVQDGTLTIDVPFLGFTGTKNITLNPSEVANIPYVLLLPVTLISGGNVTATFTTAGYQLTKTLLLSIAPLAINQNVVFDKASYRIRENLGMNYIVTNNANFASPLNASFNISIPDMNYTYNGSLTLEPGKPVEIPFNIAIPETVLAGQHQVLTSITIPSGVIYQGAFSFVVPESSLEIASPSLAMTAGDTINLIIENTGGVDTTFTTEKLSITDGRGVIIYQGNVTGTIMAGEKKTFADIQIPSQSVNGLDLLSIQVKDGITLKSSYFYKTLNITGLAATLQARTDKPAYLKTEAITGISNIANGQFGIDSGSLKITVSKIKAVGLGQFEHFLPKTGWASFNNPMGGVAISPDGFVYIADSYNNRIQKFDSNGNFITKWGSLGNGDGQFYRPAGIAVSSDGFVYVTDTNNSRIQKFDSNGNFITKWGTRGSGFDGMFNYPTGVAISSDGFVYVTDTSNSRIQKFDSDGNFIAKWGSYGSGNGQLVTPYGIAVGSDGYVYVAEYGNYRIQKFDSNGNFITKWGGYGNGDGRFYLPYDVVIAPDGSIYVNDYGNSRIQKFDSNGNFIIKWGSSGGGNGQFFNPYGIAVDSNGFVYVNDSGNKRIQKFDSNGKFLAKWGNYCRTDSNGDGVPDDSCNGRFYFPRGIEIGAGGAIYVADSSNHRIQKFDSNGNFITKWGGYGTGDGQFYSPRGMSVAADGSIYIADSYNNRIQKFDGNENFITKWGSSGSGDGQFYSLYDVAVSSDGYIYVPDSNNYRIQKFDSNGNFITKWGSYGSGDGQFSYPYGIAVDSNGFVYVSDNSRIQKFDRDGNFITRWGSSGSGDGQFRSLLSIAIDIDDAVYIADSYNNRIQKFDSNGNFITKWGSLGNGDGQFNQPWSIAVGAVDGTVYVADTYNHRIQKMTPSSGSFGTLFETTIPITQPSNTTQDYTTSIGTLNATGKLYLNAELKNSIGQTIATSEYPFYIIQGNTVLLFSADKKFYKPNETVTITGEVQNRATITASGLSLTLSSQKSGASSQNLYNATFDVPANGTHPFTITTTAATEGTYTLTGKVTQNTSTLVEIADQYEVANPKATVTVTAPEVVGNELFTMSVELKNTGKVPTTVQLVVTPSPSPSPAGGEGNVWSGDSQTILIPAGETKILQYSQQITTNTTYTFTFTGDIEQTIQKQVVFGEKAAIQLDMQPLYKEGDIAIPFILSNSGLIEATYPVTFTLYRNGAETAKTVGSFVLPVNGSVSSSLVYNLVEGLYTLKCETTGFQSESQINVVKAGQGVIALLVNEAYPEGTISIPYTITNTGQFDSDFTVNFEIGASVITKSIFIQKGGNYTGELSYPLSSGNYAISALLISYPSIPVSKSFKVLKENYATMEVAVGSQTSELLPVTVNLTNAGYNEINGSVQLSAISNQGILVWNSSQDVSLPYALNATPYTLTFNINPSAIAPGAYTLKAELFNNSNQQLAVHSSQFTVHGPQFQITQLPSYQTFTVGQEASFTFKVKNTGNQEGPANLVFKAYDLINSTRTEWLKPGEEKEIAFSFMLPEDLEEKDYFADYTLTSGDSPYSTTSSVNRDSPLKGQIKYHVAGINLSVNATLDKQYYSEGETAHLTIAVSSQQSAVSLFARVNYNGYENQQAFTLGQGNAQPLQFDIPLTQITGEKLFYGIYHEGGRSIHLNSLYIYKAGDAITITTDKQVYAPGELVSAEVRSQKPEATGTMTLSGPNYEETFNFSGTAHKSFILPSTMTAGTYNISYQLSDVSGQSYSGSHSFDVNGIQVKVLECKNDKGKYASSDTITTSFTISSNTNMPAILKAWIVDPEGKYTSAGEVGINLVSSENLLLTSHFSLLTSASGIHRLVYGIYSGDMLLVSGSEAFDVGDAVLLGLSTDKTDYPTNSETVTVSISVFGTIAANLELQLDGTTVRNEAVALNGFVTSNMALDRVKPGTHTLKGTLTAGGLKSTKETSFVYGSNLPDLRAEVRSQKSEVGKDNTIQIITTVTNQGKTQSSATTISLYDNDNLLEAKTINALNSGESQEITFIWSVLGKAGEHVIKAIADPDNTVTEFNEENNTATTNITVPDITLITETDKDTYKIREKVNINSFITNLTSTKTYQNLTMLTSVKDPSGNEVFQKNTVIAGLLPSGSAQLAETWSTTGLQVDGTYTITQTLFKEGDPTGSPYIQSSKLIALQKAPDFTLRTDTDYRKIKQGEKATYTAYIEQVNGWISEIALGIEGLPAGTSVSFSPGTLIPPGSALTVIITTDATTPGIHNLSLTAQGVDEGETVTHTLPLILDVSGFGLSSEASSKTIKQLETATFDVKLDAMNGYEGEVNLSVDSVPFGVKASFDKTKLQAPGNAKLTVLTSKYARPGDYTLTVTGDDGLVKHKLNLNLVLQSNPQISAGIITAQGPGPNNQAEVKVFNSSLQPVLDLTAFNTKYGAYAIGADIDGDGYDEIIVSQGPDPKNSATLKAFRRNGTPIAEYTAFDTKYGLTLSSGDIDGDWKDEIIVGMGPDPKNPATIKILKYNGSGFTELMTKTVFDTKYGLNTAVGDVDGDGMPEIITSAGPSSNNPAIVKIWKKDGQNLSELYSFTAFDGSYGANIATGDIDGDGKAEIIVGTGPDPKNPAIVKIFKADGILLMELKPYDARYGYGVTVSSEDIDGDGIDEIITGLGPGPQNPSWVKVFRYDGSEIYSFMSYPDSVKYGVKVSKGNVGN